MFDLNKIINILKKNHREIVLLPEDAEALVIMPFDRYQELRNDFKQNTDVKFLEKNINFSKNDISKTEYAEEVKNTIMPEI